MGDYNYIEIVWYESGDSWYYGVINLINIVKLFNVLDDKLFNVLDDGSNCYIDEYDSFISDLLSDYNDKYVSYNVDLLFIVIYFIYL